MPDPRPSSRHLHDDDHHRRRRSVQLAQALEDTRDPIARRDFLTRMGAAIAFAGLGACTRAPRQEIVPYVKQPLGVTPGQPRFYATASTLDGYATGILVESNEGRPTKVEGNPIHPASLGASGVLEQASVLTLYEPSRARGVTEKGSPVTWPHVQRALTSGRWTNEQGRGLYLLLEPTASPTTVALLAEIRQRLPRASVSFYAATTPVNVWEGSRVAFGRVLEPRFALDRADVVVALDSDFLTMGPMALRLARQFADRREVHGPTDTMNRLYSVEALYTATGASADHRLRVRAGDVLSIAAALANEVLPSLANGIPPALVAPAAPHQKWIAAVARDLKAHRGRSVIIAGDAQPPEVHALAHAMNAALGNIGTTVTMAPSPIAEAGDPSHDLARLADALSANEVDTLVVCGTNVAYASPAERGLAALLSRARQSAYLGLFADETSDACTFTIAQAHSLESWGDASAFDGTLSIVQPLIEPLFDGRTELDVLALFAGRPDTSSYDLVRARFRRDLGRVAGSSPGPQSLPPGEPSAAAMPAEAERLWRQALKRGLVDGTAIGPASVGVRWSSIAAQLARRAASPPALRDAIELVSRPDPRMHDGRFANNAWLLELPTPIAKLTWTNAATLSAETAAKLGIATGEELELRAGAQTVRAPACVVPGQAEGTIGLALGWGRSRGAEVAHGRGANAYVILPTRSATSTPVEIKKTGARKDLPITQTEHDLHGRGDQILHHQTLEEYRHPPEKPQKKRVLSLYGKEPGPAPYQWGMAIDLSRCTGCGACVIACQAENNIPTVGPDGVFLNREMHWLRIDTYHLGDPNDPQVVPQPMLCQHCEMAPCEYVCPVNATEHSPDGLNEMVYNRCVGTRFCSNNCPYKVRRFNWFDYHQDEPPVRSLVHNPDVTVRQRGVMEKCTFCVQRLRQFEIRSRQGKAKAPPQTACQQSCATRAIVFGDLLDKSAVVTRLQQSDRAYGALEDLGTEPRVRYLARIRNANPELE